MEKFFFPNETPVPGAIPKNKLDKVKKHLNAEDTMGRLRKQSEKNQPRPDKKLKSLEKKSGPFTKEEVAHNHKWIDEHLKAAERWGHENLKGGCSESKRTSMSKSVVTTVWDSMADLTRTGQMSYMSGAQGAIHIHALLPQADTSSMLQAGEKAVPQILEFGVDEQRS